MNVSSQPAFVKQWNKQKFRGEELKYISVDNFVWAHLFLSERSRQQITKPWKYISYASYFSKHVLSLKNKQKQQTKNYKFLSTSINKTTFVCVDKNINICMTVFTKYDMARGV